MAIDSNVLQEVVDALKQDPEIKNNVYQATVSRIDGEGVVWVNIAGSDTETPTAITSAEVAPGDAVNVEWRNNKLYIGGNYSNPSAGVVRVEAVEAATQVASEAAANAVQEATRARDAADRAEGEAVRAGEAADRAEGKADDAADAAGNAQTSADSALVSLSTVEDVVGVLNWITEHGTMTLTSDVTVNPAHVYFVVDPAGDYVVGGTHYSIVSEPKDAELSTYYELSVDESVQNYVATHVVVDTEGLWLIPENNVSVANSSKKILISVGGVGHSYPTAGTYIIEKVNGTDQIVAMFTAAGVSYGDSTTASGTNSFALGQHTTAGGQSSQAAGYYSTATATLSHAEGYTTHATSEGATAIGKETTASGDYSFSEGYSTTASGAYSHAQGTGTTADQQNQFAIGKYNTTSNTNNLFVVGNGSKSGGNITRKDAFQVDIYGNVEASGNVNIASGAKYKINGTNLSASDVGALSTNDKYTRSSAGGLDWVNQTDGDAKIIMKSALAFWNGTYNGSGSNLSKCSTGNIIGSNGGTMTGQLKTSFKTSVAMGSYGSAQTTVEGLVGEVRFSSGCAGSASINTAYTNSGITIPTGWYNFMYMPHRSGGNSGAADGDNANYGNLFLFGMNNTNGRFIVRVSSGSIADVCRIWTSLETVDYVVEQGTSGIWTYRKWNSGVAECWGTYSSSIAVNTTSAGYGGYRSGEITATAYPFTFISIPIVTATCGAGSNSAHVVNVQGSTVSNCKFYLGSGVSSAAASRSIHIHAIGKWK